MSNFNTLSAILRSPWLIEQQFAVGMLPWITSLYAGNNSTAIPPLNGSQSEMPFIIDPKTMQRYEWWDEAPSGSVAIIPITGAITKYNGECGRRGTIGTMSYVQQVDSRENLLGALYLYDTPGGQAWGTGALASAIRTAKKKSVAYVDDGMAASAGMWLFSASTEGYASMKTSYFGSIGAYSTLVDYSDFFTKQGIKVHEIYAPQSVDKNASSRDALSGDDSLIKEDLKYLVDQFSSFVSARSALAAEMKSEWDTGKLFKASDAKKYGLIDGIISFDKAISRVVALNKDSSPLPSNTNKKMANQNISVFQKTITASKGDAFALEEGGFLLSENQLHNIELYITGQENTIVEQGTRINTLTEDSNAAQATISALKTKVTDLQQHVTRLGKKDAGDWENPAGGDDDPPKPDPYAAARAKAFPGHYK